MNQCEWSGTKAQEGTLNTSDNTRMKLGIVLPEAEHDMAGETAGWRDYKAMAQLAEQIGLVASTDEPDNTILWVLVGVGAGVAVAAGITIGVVAANDGGTGQGAMIRKTPWPFFITQGENDDPRL